jgi:RNA polymerase sigma factor (sigma-70 family)
MDDAALTRGAAGISALASTVDGGTKTAEVEDGELVRRVRRGDDRAFEQLYHRYHRRITAYIHGMVHDHARAEDVAQDVFVSALRRMRDTDRPIAFKPWVYEIAKNACIDQFRRSKRAEEVSYDADEGMGAADYGRLVSSDAMPEAQLESKQNLDHLRGAFGGLSETHHEILVMRELEGLSYREIGERLGMSRPSVESTLFRARRRLTEEYEELVSGARCQRIQSIIAGASGTAPGARDQRRLARHVSHCQPCRRQARLAGLDIPVTPDRPVRQRIAAMLPLPFFLRKRWSADNADATSLGTTQLGGFAQWSAQFGAVVGDPSWIKAAATAATVAVAGAGAGLAGSPSRGSSSSIGSISQLGPSMGDDVAGEGKRFTAGSGPKVTAALRTGIAPAAGAVTTAATAPGSAGTSGAPGTAGAPASDASTPGTTGSGAPAVPTGSDVVEQAGAGLDGVATAVSGGSDGGSGVPDTSGGPGGSAGSPPNANASTPAAPSLPNAPSASAPQPPPSEPPAAPQAPAAPAAPSAPSASASAPNASGVAEEATGAAGEATGGLTGQ